MGGKKQQAGGGIAVGRAGFGLHHRKVGVRRNAEKAREVRHHLADFLAALLRHGGLRPAEVERRGPSPPRCCPEKTRARI